MNELRSKFIRLAHARPDEIASRVASRYVQASGWKEISKQEASLFMSEVWDMYVQTYSAIGLTQSSASEMLADYNHYMLAMDGDKPIAFSFGKRTQYGVKLGLLGSFGVRWLRGWEVVCEVLLGYVP
jgi:hypothetical protein